jgi:hypothetical protein
MIAAIADVTFNGQKQTPTPVVSYNDGEDIITLTAGTDFTFSYGTDADNIHAGVNVGIVKITAKDGSNYSGFATKNFTILPLALASVTVGEIENQTYAYGAAITPELTVTGTDADNNNFPLRKNLDYTVNYGEGVTATNVNAGEALGVLSVVATGDFTFPEEEGAVANATFTIDPKNLGDEDITISEIANQDYTGAAIEPEGVTVTWTIGEGEGAVRNNITDFLTITSSNNTAVGTATIKATPKAEGGENYTGEAVSSFSILPTSIAGANVTFGGEIVYTGSPLTPDFTVSFGAGEDAVVLSADEYEIVSWGNNTDATQGDEDDDKAYVIIKGKGNYEKVSGTGDPITKKAYFVIAKKPVVITASDINVNFGVSPAEQFASTLNTVEGEDIGGKVTYTVYDNNEEPVIVEEANYAALAVSEGRYTVKATWAANPAPAVPVEGVTYDTEAQIAAQANYDLSFEAEGAIVPGAITVSYATLTIKPVNVTVKYGSEEQELAFEVYDGETKKEGVVFTEGHAPVLARAEGANVGEYAITVTNQTGENAVASAAYTFEFAEGTYKIDPFPITVTANDQTILYGSEPEIGVLATSLVKTVNEEGQEVAGDKVTVTISPATTGNQVIIDRGVLNLTLTLAANYDGSVKEHAEALVPAINNPNFIATIVPGTLTVKANTTLAFDDSKDDNLIKINANDGVKANVTIKFSARNARAAQWKADTWATMTLPFDISVGDLSKALGYAVVNVIDPSRTTIDGTGSTFYGKLTMKGGNGKTDVLAANKPFMVKTADDITGVINFGSRTIVAPTADLSIEAGEGAMFTGTYTGKTVTSEDNQAIWFMTGSDSKWWYIGSQGSWNILPFEGFIDMSNASNPAGARGMTFVFEEIDGSTTAIKGISTDDLNKQSFKVFLILKVLKMDCAPLKLGFFI